jgi:hypothetical protein
MNLRTTLTKIGSRRQYEKDDFLDYISVVLFKQIFFNFPFLIPEQGITDEILFLKKELH